MIDQTYVELIHREIDGVNTREESLTLKQHLERNPEARKLYDELFQMAGVLDRVQDLEPPGHLHRNVIRNIQSLPAREKWRRSHLTSLLNGLPKIMIRRYAYAFSLGLVAGIIIFTGVLWTLSKDRTLNVRELYGTITSKTLPSESENGEGIEIDLKEMQGHLRYWYSTDRLNVEFELDSQAETELSISFDQHDLTVSSFSQRNEGGSYLQVLKSRLELTHMGQNSYTFTFFDKTGKDTFLKFQARTFGSLIFERIIEIKHRTE
jgi:hypothetical protein